MKHPHPHRLAMLAALGAVATLVASAAGTAGAAPARPQATRAVAVCPKPAARNMARCFALALRGAGKVAPGTLPEGYGPGDLASAYKLPSSGGSGQTVAIVDAMDDPAAEANLAVYRHTFGLPPCTSQNGCFTKVGELGPGQPLPAPDASWAVEESLDLDMVSAACPACHIVLVEANSPLITDLGQSVDTAVSMGASVVSNSYGLQESGAMKLWAHFYRHSGVTVTASTGDFGFGPANFPAVEPYVLAVGGTSLTTASNARGWSESVWGDEFGAAGSGCSAYVAKPAWQHDKLCSMRTVGDVSADADPATGPAVYDTYKTTQFGLAVGWNIIGGTSASSPYIAGVIGLAGNGKTLPHGYAYLHRDALFDVVGGSNGFCGKDYLCTGVKGYDAPSGWGSPDGTGAF